MKDDNQAQPDNIGNNRRYNIPGDKVNQSTAELPDEQRKAIRWLHLYASEKDLPMVELARLLKRKDGSTYDPNTVYKVLTGRHEAALDNFVESINEFKKLLDARGTINRLPFVETNLTRRIFKICESALIYQKIAFIFGPSQTGKTTALEEYQRTHNHGETLLIRMPAGGSLRDLIQEFAAVCRISPVADNLKRRIINFFDDRMLLIIDEAHQCVVRGNGQARIQALEFIREIFDRSRCGLVICATPILEDEFVSGPNKKLLEQFDLRSLTKVRLPERPGKSELNAIAAHYNLEPAKGEALKLQTEIIQTFGLGRWCTILQAASRLAAKRVTTMTWEHVIKAHAGLKALENPDSFSE